MAFRGSKHSVYLMNHLTKKRGRKGTNLAPAGEDIFVNKTCYLQLAEYLLLFSYEKHANWCSCGSYDELFR